jgi:predicted phage baseplate assembly protein
VIADYRQGSGLSGRVAANALRTPLDLPTGLKSVSNPLAATGGADPEPIEQARENAPTTVRTFGRAVSLPDFEDLVRSSGEVAKAFATWVWDGESRAVHLTIAAQGGAAFLPEDITRIQASVDAARDPNHALFMDNFVPVPIVVTATLIVEPTRSAKAVAAAAREALLASLSFEVLGFGQPLALSEVVAILQGVVGVVAVDVDLFHFKDRSAAVLAARGASADPAQRSLRIFPARPSAVPYPPVLPAEMASIEAPADDVLIATSGGLPD